MWEYVKGSEQDFEGAPDDILFRVMKNNEYWFSRIAPTNFNCAVIAERRKVGNLQSRVNDANLQQFVKVETRVPSKEESDAYNKRFDTVQRPAHYNQSGIECIDAIAASMTPAEFQAYLKGNVQKYLWRYQHKNGAEDCRKAQWYLDRLVKELSK